MEVTVGTLWVQKKPKGSGVSWTTWREFYSEFKTDFEQICEGVTSCRNHKRIILEFEVDDG